jgi:hypothetical protein
MVRACSTHADANIYVQGFGWKPHAVRNAFLNYIYSRFSFKELNEL